MDVYIQKKIRKVIFARDVDIDTAIEMGESIGEEYAVFKDNNKEYRLKDVKSLRQNSRPVEDSYMVTERTLHESSDRELSEADQYNSE